MSAGLRSMMLAAFWFSVMSMLVKAAAVRGFPSQEIVLARALVTLVLSWLTLRQAGISLWGVNRRLLVARGVVGSIALMAYYASVAQLPLADATIIQYTNPVMTAVFAAWALGERVEKITWVGAAASLVGVALVARPSFLFGDGATAIPPAAIGLALFGSAMSAVSYVLIRQLRRTDDPRVIVWYFPLIAVPLSLPFMALDFRMPVGSDWLLLLGIGISTQLGQVFMTRALHAETAARATGMSYLQIAFAFAWGIVLFGEHPAWSSLVGAGVIVLGTVGASWLMPPGAATPLAPQSEPAATPDPAPEAPRPHTAPPSRPA